jgi:hypothetical protein
MIQGIQLDVTAAELIERLGDRIAHHRSRAAACEAQLETLAGVETETYSADESIARIRFGSPREGLRERLREHRARAAFLTFLRDHLVPNETYRLTERDLRTIDVIPGRASA